MNKTIAFIVMLVFLSFGLGAFFFRTISPNSVTSPNALSSPTITQRISVTQNNPTSPNTPVQSESSVNLFFSNTKKGGNNGDCGLVYSVTRSIPQTQTVARLALTELFKGPTAEERVDGYTSFFSPATVGILNSVNVKNGTAYVDLKDIRSLIPNASTSCGSAQFFAQVEETLTQFPTITKVIYAINSDPEPFYEWMQIGCAEENNNCDATPFQ